MPEVDDDQFPLLEEAVDSAIGILWALTGRRFGLTAVEARPCPPDTSLRGVPLSPGPGWAPVLDAGTIRNAPTCQAVSCRRDGALLLPGPVRTILGWTTDGQEMDVSLLHRAGDLVWLNNRRWPLQDLSLPASEYGTWSIRYLRGEVPPPGASGMVAALAREYLAAATGGTCQLPQRATQVQRQGVTVSMVDPTEIYESGATGITEVDLWIKAMNPHGLSQPSTVWSPDMSAW